MLNKVKEKVFSDFKTEHLIEGMPLEHLDVVNVLLVYALTIILIIIFSFSFWKGVVAGNNAIELNGVI